ncbi:MAG TPA: FecR domain-containing protein [Vicinamibacterales bacterium]|nr:FecR domain-containing protein [Vicinamibacterales bacterium]
MRHHVAPALAVLLFASTAFGQQAEAVGRIKLVSGAVFLVRGQTQVAAQAGQLLYQSDLLRTGSDGNVGVALKDDTRVALGPASEVRLDHFSYAPAEGQLALVLKVVRGVVAYVSGHIAKLAPDAIRIETPAAILGVRGTTLAIRIDNQ